MCTREWVYNLATAFDTASLLRFLWCFVVESLAHLVYVDVDSPDETGSVNGYIETIVIRGVKLDPVDLKVNAPVTFNQTFNGDSDRYCHELTLHQGNSCSKSFGN